MNEQLLAELERKLQNNEISREEYQKQKTTLENQNLLVQDFEKGKGTPVDNAQTNEYCYPNGVCIGVKNPDEALYSKLPKTLGNFATANNKNWFTDGQLDISKISKDEILNVLNSDKENTKFFTGTNEWGAELNETPTNLEDWVNTWKNYQTKNQEVYGLKTVWNIGKNEGYNNWLNATGTNNSDPNVTNPSQTNPFLQTKKIEYSKDELAKQQASVAKQKEKELRETRNQNDPRLADLYTNLSPEGYPSDAIQIRGAVKLNPLPATSIPHNPQLATPYIKAQEPQITTPSYEQAPNVSIFNEDIFKGDFTNISGDINNTEIGSVQDQLNGNYTQAQKLKLLNSDPLSSGDLMPSGINPSEDMRKLSVAMGKNPVATSIPQINTGMVSDLFNIEFPSRAQSAPLETGIQGQDNISYNDPQYNENQKLPLRSATIENPNLNTGDLMPSGINASEEAKKLSLIYPNATENIAKYTDTNSTKEAPLDFKQSFEKFLPFMNPYGSNIETELYSLGKFIGTEKGTEGRGLGIASSALSAGLGGARTLLSGLAQQTQTEKTAEEIRRKLALKNYTPQTQYLNQNSRGGI